MGTLYFVGLERNAPKTVLRDTGLSPEQFTDLFKRLPTLRSSFRDLDLAKDALYMYLMKVRTALPNEDIGKAFEISKSTVGHRLDEAREALKTDFMPDHINFVPDRVELLTKSTDMCNGLFNPDGNKVVLVCDGTYIFINKSRNYKMQRDSYTDQKKRNNIKIMMAVTTNVFIVYALGPYKAGQNDAQILKELDQTTNIFDGLQNVDIFLLDRGFRDCVDGDFKAKGLDVKIPAFQRSSNKSQLSTADANQTRLVTALRFVVEVRNGHMKTVFKIFNTVWNSLALPHLTTDFQICASLLNFYHGNIESIGQFANEMAALMLSRMDVVNEVFKITSKKQIQQRLRSCPVFEDFDSLPYLQSHHLVRISLGKYQIKQAQSYCSQYMKSNGGLFNVFSLPEELCHTHFTSFFSLECNPVLLLVQLDSRFRNKKYYNTFVLVNKLGHDEKAVLGYCCECYNGLRTVGCCSHVMTIIWFALFVKNHDIPIPAGFLDDFFDKNVDAGISDEPPDQHISD